METFLEHAHATRSIADDTRIYTMKTHVIYICHQILSLKGLCDLSGEAKASPFLSHFPSTLVQTSLSCEHSIQPSTISRAPIPSRYGAGANKSGQEDCFGRPLSFDADEHGSLVSKKVPCKELDLDPRIIGELHVHPRCEEGVEPTPTPVKRTKLGRWD
jgi:hypothetical protein